jgi:hypothetical protein
LHFHFSNNVNLHFKIQPASQGQTFDELEMLNLTFNPDPSKRFFFQDEAATAGTTATTTSASTTTTLLTMTTSTADGEFRYVQLVRRYSTFNHR